MQQDLGLFELSLSLSLSLSA